MVKFCCLGEGELYQKGNNRTSRRRRAVLLFIWPWPPQDWRHIFSLILDNEYLHLRRKKKYRHRIKVFSLRLRHRLSPCLSSIILIWLSGYQTQYNVTINDTAYELVIGHNPAKGRTNNGSTRTCPYNFAQICIRLYNLTIFFNQDKG